MRRVNGNVREKRKRDISGGARGDSPVTAGYNGKANGTDRITVKVHAIVHVV